jgi:hypothetical protein
MANLLDEGVGDTLMSAVSAALFQRRQLPVQRPNLLESRGGIAQECGNTEKGPGITAKRKDRKFDRDLSAVLVEGRHRQKGAAAIVALGAAHDLFAGPLPADCFGQSGGWSIQ